MLDIRACTLKDVVRCLDVFMRKGLEMNNRKKNESSVKAVKVPAWCSCPIVNIMFLSMRARKMCKKKVRYLQVKNSEHLYNTLLYHTVTTGYRKPTGMSYIMFTSLCFSKGFS